MTNRETYRFPVPIAPGETLQESIDLLQITPADLAEKTGVSVAYVRQVLAGHTRITPEFASALTQVFDVPAAFWLRYDQNYHQALAEQ
ncbi:MULTISPECIES: HigA family addiction module antitoxin [Levilactobacillus]|uniref:HigA family addiction module antitoxin n=1 Tax=Levilactobacillus TaxID=2767886 RepID=UPI0019528572|nr:HigA family addiction module antitoxin [Levilactobacillus sp. 244-2]